MSGLVFHLILDRPTPSVQDEPMTPQEISDRIEIQDVLVRYCHAVDRKDWKAFEKLFTENAVLDYSAFGGPLCDTRAMSSYLNDAVSDMHGTQHTISTSLLEIDGNTATAQTAAQVMMISGKDDGTSHVLFIGLWYRDTLVKTLDGWRIHTRTQEHSWVYNIPPSEFYPLEV
jgi:ketosteroid isomerase-like protein